MSDKIRKIIGGLLLVTGIVGLSSSFIISYMGEKKNKELIDNFQWETVLEEPTVDFDENDNEKKNDDMFKKNVIAVINIPKVEIRYPVVKGTDANTLKKSLGYFEDTAMPGQKGNFAVAGHRNSSYAKYFNRLDEVDVGDEIIVETKEKTYTYIVDKTFKIHETETSVLDQTEDKRITLITCTNGYKPKYRIVVQGVLKESA